MAASSHSLTRKERWLLFGVFAVALLAAVLREWNIPQYCLRLLRR
jgi:hypothetical protein